ncbi:uncharacterized protein LOC104265958 isoform X2 [Ciona intestinalis]
MEKECMIHMGDYKTFSPKVDLFTFDQKLRRINETLDLTEINGRTGFTIEDKHLLLKDCYLCSEFKFPISPSKIFLQTPLSACPCKLSKFKSRHWIGDISFDTFLEAPNRVTTDFVFEIKVNGTSFCDLRTRFTLRFPAQPTVSFVLWEYVVILVFILISVVSLAVSYNKYIVLMKETKKKMK